MKFVDLTNEDLLETSFIAGMASKGGISYSDVQAMDMTLYGYAKRRGIEICKALGLLKKE